MKIMAEENQTQGGTHRDVETFSERENDGTGKEWKPKEQKLPDSLSKHTVVVFECAKS